jgi:uncharacterized membrane protein
MHPFSRLLHLGSALFRHGSLFACSAAVLATFFVAVTSESSYHLATATFRTEVAANLAEAKPTTLLQLAFLAVFRSDSL